VLLLERLKNAYALTRIINHEVGFSLMEKVSKEEKWNLNFSEIARIWTNGCIIRSTLMENLAGLFQQDDSLFRSKEIISKVKGLKSDLVSTVGMALQHEFALPVMSGAANYLFGRIIDDSSANMLQAQRDYFGAHTYQRKNDPLGKYHHTDWQSLLKKPSKAKS
jgi:6-phosphogluconate dehydrogenase